jgi:hypothetical protein
MEELALANGRSLEAMTLLEQDELWKTVKNAGIRQNKQGKDLYPPKRLVK